MFVGLGLVSIAVSTLFLFFFFFQAEDGIRDYKVTGVQTCALPILRCATASSALTARIAPASAAGIAPPNARVPTTLPDSPRMRTKMPITTTTEPTRSEERRVGKECRSREARDEERIRMTGAV